MSISINVAGVWKTEAAPSINVAGVWKTPDEVSINVSGVWKSVYTPLSVSIDVNGRVNSRLNATCYAGAYFLTNGYNYEYNSSGGGVSLGTWLDAGDASDVWLLWTRTGGTLGDWNSLDGGDTRVQVSQNRYWRIQRTSNGVSTIIGYWRAYDAASGGNLLDTGPTGTYSAEYIFEGCPLCCFTPDTLITMASGLQMPIGDIREGDEIIVQSPDDGKLYTEKVDEVIVRLDREMWRIDFEDGTHLRASADHPIHVKGKGYSSIHPYEYKDLGVPEKLAVGDYVTTIDGKYKRIVKLDRIHYPGAVFTFSNSFWFANGNLVY